MLEITSTPELTIVTEPGTEPWVLNPDDAQKIATWMRNDVTLEYWPRSRIAEAWGRDSGTSDDPERQDLNFRGYSFATPERGHVAVIFVDDIESYTSATFVVLHEMAHLHAPPWTPPTDITPEQLNEEEDRADEVANRLMSTLLGYPEGPYEVRRQANPGGRCCPMHRAQQ
ncbi:hypothetical protein LCGC14_2826750 [marine sediment metagenome]|uniref:IrrE N-terminal-like domain-containing protein n=1 Tax=marine sediment metagenome TaxID=412755 RepID=A0A0F8YF89_9ZZZZ